MTVIESECGNTLTLAEGIIPDEVYMTDSAVERITHLLTDQGNQYLRLAVSGGGCSGFQYVFGLSNELQPEDYVFIKDGANLIVDDISMEYLKGSTIDFIKDFGGEYFRVNNPHAKSECGCGSSFSPE